MVTSLIQTIHEDYKKRGQCEIPQNLLPPQKGYILINWVRELFIHYETEGIVSRALDDLPPILLSTQNGLRISLQDVHKFIISDLNLIPLEGKKRIIQQAVHAHSSKKAWQQIIPVLLLQLHGMNRETVQEEVSWRFSPVGEILWVLAWFFMELENILPPSNTLLICDRFPYYMWVTEAKVEVGFKESLWQPDNPLCRWEWLAMDLFYNWLQAPPA
jgi:hypothetical protein